MKKDIAILWTSALRSREFTQGFGYLDRNGSMCFMGVLTNLAMISGVCDVVETQKGYAFDNEMGRLPLSVKEWAGMRGQNGEMEGEFVNLTAYNDFYGYNFTELAEIIEENYERL